MPSNDFFKAKNVAVTGGVGSIGQALVRRLSKFDVNAIRVIDNNESALFDFEQEFADDKRVSFQQCDVCDEHELTRVLSDMHLCFHAAALKHVPSCERSPFSAVSSNILGVQSLIRAAIANDLEKVLFTSSDKAVNPTNVMGTSKLMGERLFTAANFLRSGRGCRTIFTSTRFGNVAGSRGSVIPLFCKQATEGTITLTDRRMTRFIMSAGQAVDLLLKSIVLARGGEVFITKMPVLRVEDLASVMIALLGPLRRRPINVVEIGARPGEKLWEELSTEEESRRLLEGDDYLVVLPAIVSREVLGSYIYPSMAMRPSTRVYHSEREPPMSQSEVKSFLLQPGVLPHQVRQDLNCIEVAAA